MKIWLIAVAVVVVTALVAAPMFLISTGPQARQGNGTLALAVHDAPCTTCSHVWVTFESATVHESSVSTSSNGTNLSSSGWVALNVTHTTVDLMALNGTAFAKVIGVASLPAGHYEMIRLNVSSVVVGLSDGTNVTASIPLASADIHGSFVVSVGMNTTVSVDIDLASSLHVTTVGGVVMATFTPDIGAVDVTTTG